MEEGVAGGGEGAEGYRAAGRELAWCFSCDEVRLFARSLGKSIGVVSEGGWGVGKCASERFRSDRSLRDSPLSPLFLLLFL